MLRITLQAKSLIANEISIITQQLPALFIGSTQASQFTSLSRFSSSPSSSLADSSRGFSSDAQKPSESAPNVETQPKAETSSAASSPSNNDTSAIDPEKLSPTMRRVHDNSALWRKWLEGKIDEKLQEPRTQSPKTRRPFNPNQQQGPRSPPYTQYQNQQQQQQRHPNQQHQFQQNRPTQPKWRTKDPSKDWKHAARTARSAEERIVNIVVPDSDPASQGKGKYGWLGSATDAPKINAAITARAEEMSPQRLHPHRLFYPGQTYSPDELDPYKVTDFMEKTGRLFAAKTTVQPKVVEEFADFRNGAFLSQFVTATGKLLPRRRTKLSAKLHSALCREIKLARNMALLHPLQRSYETKRYAQGKGFAEGSLGVPKQLVERQQQQQHESVVNAGA